MRTVEPKVYLIGKPELHYPGILEWLNDMGVENFLPRVDGGVGAGLVELAGRRCYKSFELGLNPNLSKIRNNLEAYIDNILSSGHGCYDSETEVLTEDGWKKWPDVTIEDSFCTMNHDQKIIYSKPIRLVQYIYKGRMYQVDSQGVDLLVTPNHNMFVSSINDRSSYNMIKAKDLGNKSYAYMKDGVWDIGDFPEPQDWLALLGFTIGDGYIPNKGTRNYIDIKIKRQDKKEWLRSILNTLGWKYIEKDEGRKDVVRFYIFIPEKYRNVFHQIYSSSREKQIPHNLLTTYSCKSLRKLFEGLMRSDGTSSEENGYCYRTVSKILADQMQILALHIGFSSNITSVPPRTVGFHSDKPMYRVGIIKKNFHPAVNKVKGDPSQGRSFCIENWEGEVFCAEMPNNISNHTLFVRRNGKSVWSGNSVLEHVNYTFAMEGVSRTFTTEYNRHHSGTAISEGSLRYIRFNDIPYWIPNSIVKNNEDDEHLSQQKEDTREIFEEVFQFIEDKYKELEDLWDINNISSFHMKKILTSMFRRIVPMGVSTGGVWSGNIRALRHIIAMRSDPAAEEEIMLVVSQMLKIMMEYEPLLFKDFYFDEKVGAWKCVYNKV